MSSRAHQMPRQADKGKSCSTTIRSEVRKGPVCRAVRADGQPGAKRDLAILQIGLGGRASNSLKDWSGARSTIGRQLSEVTVPVITLDDLMAASEVPPSLVKIDVEGAEIAVLRGATNLLRDVRPRIYIEIGEDNIAAATTIFHEAGYGLYALSNGTLAPIDRCAFNTIAIPNRGTEGKASSA